jgi:hypothetical protein
MNLQNSKSPYILSIVILVLGAIASAGGLVWDNLYKDSEIIMLAWIGNDAVTLFVVVPAMVWSMVKSKKGSGRAQLIWMGLLGYFIYNYAFYLFGAVLNKFFLLYVALFSLSVYALILSLMRLDLTEVAEKFSERTPVKWISIFLLFISLPLAMVELGMVMDFMLTGKTPAVPSLIFALDLSIVVPNTAVAAILIWKRKPWGFMLTAMMLVKAFTYGLGLSISTIIVALKADMDPLLPFYLFITVGGMVFLYIFLKTMRLQLRTKH